jgi:hypothetical protein
MARKQTPASELASREWLRPVEAQRLFGVGASKLWEWINSGYLVVSRPDPTPNSRIVLIRREEIEKFINTGIVA